MSRLIVFNFLSLNGCFKRENGDVSWHKHIGGEEHAFSEEMVKLGNTLLFGRVTYEMMASYWPTPLALENDKTVAEGMNNAEKIVFSRTLDKPGWKNTRLIKDNITEEIKKLKQKPGKDLTLLGSGNILTQFADEGLIDEFQFMIDPVVIHDGIPVFYNIKKDINLTLKSTRTFKSGVTLVIYHPAKN